MQPALDIFRTNLSRIRSLHTVYLSLLGSVTSIVDLSDLLRAEVVLVVSALDHFVHELTRLGMMEIWRGGRPATTAYLRFSVSMDITTRLAGAAGTDTHLEAEIRMRHGYQAFQQPDNIADAIRLFSAVDLWRDVATALGLRPEDVRSQLKLIVDRRNKIAHEADVDPSYPGQRWPISRRDVEQSIAFVEDIAETVFKLVA